LILKVLNQFRQTAKQVKYVFIYWLKKFKKFYSRAVFLMPRLYMQV